MVNDDSCVILAALLKITSKWTAGFTFCALLINKSGLEIIEWSVLASWRIQDRFLSEI